MSAEHALSPKGAEYASLGQRSRSAHPRDYRALKGRFIECSIHTAMTQPEVFEHLGQMADGGAYPAVHPEIIGAWKVALPKSGKILDTFHRTCAPLFEQAKTNRTQSCPLAILRDTRLPKLLSGEISVKKLPG